MNMVSSLLERNLLSRERRKSTELNSKVLISAEDLNSVSASSFPLYTLVF